MAGRIGRPPGYAWQPEELRAALIAEMQRLSVDGAAPMRLTYDMQRRPDLPTGNYALKLIGGGLRWHDLAIEAGLRPFRKWTKRNETEYAADWQDAETTVMPPGPGGEYDFQSLRAMPSRTETEESGGQRVTRIYMMLR